MKCRAIKSFTVRLLCADAQPLKSPWKRLARLATARCQSRDAGEVPGKRCLFRRPFKQSLSFPALQTFDGRGKHLRSGLRYTHPASVTHVKCLRKNFSRGQSSSVEQLFQIGWT